MSPEHLLVLSQNTEASLHPAIGGWRIWSEGFGALNRTIERYPELDPYFPVNWTRGMVPRSYAKEDGTIPLPNELALYFSPVVQHTYNYREICGNAVTLIGDYAGASPLSDALTPHFSLLSQHTYNYPKICWNVVNLISDYDETLGWQPVSFGPCAKVLELIRDYADLTQEEYTAWFGERRAPQQEEILYKLLSPLAAAGLPYTPPQVVFWMNASEEGVLERVHKRLEDAQQKKVDQDSEKEG